MGTNQGSNLHQQQNPKDGVPSKILIVEDSKDYQLIISACLDGYDLEIASTAQEALLLMKKVRYDLLILDVVLPDMSGMQLCSFIRSQKEFKKTPVILLTSKDSVDDKVMGFESGANHYLTKPFHHKELIARVKSLLSSLDESSDNQMIQLPNLKIDLNKQAVSYKGRQVDLTRIEFKILCFFSRRLDFVISRNQIIDEVWPDNLNILERTVDTHISNLRKKITDCGYEISAIHGSGYKFSEVKKAA